MASHFLLSASSRHLSLMQVVGLTDAEILRLLKEARWGKSDNPNQVVCPRCGVQHIAYSYPLASNGNANIVSTVFRLPQAQSFKVQNSPYAKS